MKSFLAIAFIAAAATRFGMDVADVPVVAKRMGLGQRKSRK